MFKFNELCSSVNFCQQTFVIAEIGQNHQGNINIAKKLIEVAKNCGADCVKFQKTNLNEKFNKKALQRTYASPHSFGQTYGEHKAFLEFSEAEFIELQNHADQIDILFTASAMDLHSLDFLAEINVPFIKIGSGDANNFILIEKAARTGIPLVISTGMQALDTVKKIYKIVSKYHKNFALLHCVSAYPTPYADINLAVIELYKKEFPDIAIGYSGHEPGIHISISAVALGCKIIERHITLNKNQKGSDHKCSLEPQEFKEMINNIRTLELAMGRPIKVMQNSELSCYRKLGKTLVYTRDLPEGHKLCSDDLNVKVAEPNGIDGNEIDSIIGKILINAVKEDESVLSEHIN